MSSQKTANRRSGTWGNHKAGTKTKLRKNGFLKEIFKSLFSFVCKLVDFGVLFVVFKRIQVKLGEKYGF